ncbi:MAG: GAP family protein [Microbacteriaceae bacterium]
MSEITALIPLALTIAASPVPIAGLLLILLSPNGFASGTWFVIGWCVGIAFAASGLSYLSSLLPDIHAPRMLWADALVPLLVGVLLVVAGVIQWRKRPERGAEAPLPRWMAAFERLKPGRAAVIGFAYAAFRPKSLVMAAAAGVVILRSAGDVASAVIWLLIFTVLASVTMVAPVLAYGLGGNAVRDGLIRGRRWLVGNLAVISSVALLSLGVALVVIGVGRWP